MAHHELDLAFQEHRLAPRQHVRDQSNRTDGGARLETMQPTRKEGERQGMRCCEAQRCRVGLCHRPRFARDTCHPSHQIVCCVPEPFPGCGQLGRLAASIEQLCTKPLFQRANSSAEGRLGHVPLLRRARSFRWPRGQRSHRATRGSSTCWGGLSGHQRRKKQHWPRERLQTIICFVIHQQQRHAP